MRPALQTIFVVLILGVLACKIPSAEAFFSQHPLQDYEQGLHLLDSYRGDAKILHQAQDIFNLIIEKHPDSPFGYLGVSQIKVIQAYRYDQHYNIKLITEQAMPMALEAMHKGPTLRIVHQAYDRFEKIFSDNDQNEQAVKRLLSLYPQQPKTYLALGDYLSDQGDFQKAVEYYKVALRFADEDPLKLKLLKRIQQIYSYELPDENLADQYFKAANDIENLSQSTGENNQNTSLHCNSENLYYEHDEIKCDEFYRKISQR